METTKRNPCSSKPKHPDQIENYINDIDTAESEIEFADTLRDLDMNDIDTSDITWS
jgi:hypothetical protein